MIRTGKKETLHDFTERAVDATLRGTLIPPLVYIPHRLRKREARISFDGTVTINAATAAENDIRISQADPVGFLIAIMQGQPIPRVIIERDGKELRARVDFEEPALDDRLRAAEALSRVRVKTKPGDPEYDAMIARAAGDNS